jgi:prophage regulatory protein
MPNMPELNPVRSTRTVKAERALLDLGDRIISRKELRILVPYSDMHIRRLEKAGRFPRRIRVGEARIGWSFREVQEWIAAKKAARQTAAPA